MQIYSGITDCTGSKGVRKGEVVGVNPPLSLMFYKNIITCIKDIDCFRIPFAC